MMRQYRAIPRGKTEFVYGSHYYNPFSGIHQILVAKDETTFDRFEVVPETVGQFIGRHDIHGKEIYDGDEVEYFVRKTRGTGLIRWGTVGFWIVGIGNKLQWIEHWKIAVIGNIHQQEQVKALEQESKDGEKD